MKISIVGTPANASITIEGITMRQALKLVDDLDPIKKLSALDTELVGLISQGNLLAAVKRYKDETGHGLKESKEYCDKLKEQYVKKD